MVTATRGFEHLALCLPLAGVGEAADSALVAPYGADLVLCLIDASGQGVDGRAAVVAVEAVVARMAAFHVAEVFAAAHRAAADTPGVSLGLVRISPKRGQVTFTGLGRVYGAVAGTSEIVFAGDPGTVGVGHPRVPPTHTFPWRPDAMVALASDGLLDAWDLAALWRAGDLPLESVVSRLAGSPRLPDDASILLARHR